MRKMVLVLALLCALPAGLEAAESQPPAPAPGSRALEMVDRLRALIREAEKRRAADPWLLNALRDLAGRYDWPWRKLLLRDDFRDGDFTRAPAWKVASGRFAVDRYLGLHTIVRPKAPPPQAEKRGAPQDLPSAILGEVFDRALRKRRRKRERERPPAAVPGAPAEIFIPRAISGAFAVRLRFLSRQKPGRLEFGPYSGRERKRGLRLVYVPGARRGLELIRLNRFGASILEAYEKPLGLEDRKIHEIEWRRDGRGQMTVFLDGKTLLRAATSGGGSFDGFALINRGGEFGIREIAIHGGR